MNIFSIFNLVKIFVLINYSSCRLIFTDLVDNDSDALFWANGW